MCGGYTLCFVLPWKSLYGVYEESGQITTLTHLFIYIYILIMFPRMIGHENLSNYKVQHVEVAVLCKEMCLQSVSCVELYLCLVSRCKERLERFVLLCLAWECCKTIVVIVHWHNQISLLVEGRARQVMHLLLKWGESNTNAIPYSVYILNSAYCNNNNI